MIVTKYRKTVRTKTDLYLLFCCNRFFNSVYCIDIVFKRWTTRLFVL